jgi:hypothetical protein
MARSELATQLANAAGNGTKSESHGIIVPPLMIRAGTFEIEGTAPLVLNKFSAKAREMMKAKQSAGSQAKRGPREKKDFQAAYEGAKHIATDGWCGIPAASFRHAMIRAGSLDSVGAKMTQLKMALFVQQDGFDADDGTPLIKITKGEPHYLESLVRNETGVADIRARPMWGPGWRAMVRVEWDDEVFTSDAIANLLFRAGQQVGIGEGRPFSKDSVGMGWGTFDVISGKVNETAHPKKLIFRQ